jgi:hypothetical protein
MLMQIGYQHFLFFKKPMLQVWLTKKNNLKSVVFFIDVIITIGLLDSGCVKLWAFDPRTATTNVRGNIVRLIFWGIFSDSN